MVKSRNGSPIENITIVILFYYLYFVSHYSLFHIKFPILRIILMNPENQTLYHNLYNITIVI